MDKAATEYFRGQCSACGFLCHRQAPPDQSGEVFYEFTQAERTTGDVRHVLKVPPEPWDTTISHRERAVQMVCFVGEEDLQREFQHAYDPDENLPSRKTHLAVIDRANRNCPMWTPYQPSFGPKWHLEQVLIHDARRANRRTQWVLAGIAAFQTIVAIAAIAAVIAFQKGDTTNFSPVNNIVLPTTEPTATPTPLSTPDMSDSLPQLGP